MRDLDDLRALKREYLELVRIQGREAAGFAAFRRSLLALNRRHRREVVLMYAKAIAALQKKRSPR